tara:strand:+ start:168 stop:788 length:621 start_codon:yes stop_codon:yes gene_type:complete
MLFFENFHRFRNKIFRKNRFNITDEINFGSKEANDFFEKNLNKSKFYYEFGSGSSTLRADYLDTRFVSVELDKSFFNHIQKKLTKKNINYISIGPVGEFSYPLFKNKKKIFNYINSIEFFFKNMDYPDFILVDGRFRVACCLNLLRFLDKKQLDIIVLIDDFKDRDHYKILYEYFSIQLIGRMALLKSSKKKFDQVVFEKYLLDCR